MVNARISETLVEEYEMLISQYQELIERRGEGRAARGAFAAAFSSHFEKEKTLLFPILRLLRSISKDQARLETVDILKLVNAFRLGIAELQTQQQGLLTTSEDLLQMTKNERDSQSSLLMERMIFLLRMEEEILYPAAMVVERHVRLNFGDAPV